MTFDQVEERLIEAMLVCWRSPDRERGWLRVRSLWPEVMREREAGDFGEHGGDRLSDVELRPASLTRREVAEMEQAFAWVGVLGGDERRLVGLVLTEKARGAKQVQWKRLLRAMHEERGWLDVRADALRMRYGRAMTRVAQAANAAVSCGVEAVKG